MHRAKNYQGNLKKNKVKGLILKYIKTLLFSYNMYYIIQL